MKLFTQGRYASVVSTAAMVVALGGTSYAAAQITSADIKDGTIVKADLSGKATISAKSVRNDNGTVMTGSSKSVLSVDVAPGQYVVTAKAVPMYSSTGAYATCTIVNPNGIGVDTSWWYAGSAGSGYGTLSNQAVLSVGTTGTVQLRCSGGNSTLYYKKLTALKVHSLTNLSGTDVAKAPLPHQLAR